MKNIYLFGTDVTDGSKAMRDELGGKGANLAEMAKIGLPVPPGLTISTNCCREYLVNKKLSSELKDEIKSSIKAIESFTGKELGSTSKPLLFSVRSGARISMPGMMDTVLNLGLNPDTVEALAKQSNNSRFAWDSYRRFVSMYANVVMGLSHAQFDAILMNLKQKRGYKEDSDIITEDLQKLIEVYKNQIFEETGKQFPDDPYEQLWTAVEAVFDSWDNDRAIAYRELNGYEHRWGTAVNIQSMVFGNLGETSGTGVCFSRNPSTGEAVFFGEYLMNAQGEDVVAGIRTPGPLNDHSINQSNKDLVTLEKLMPETYSKLNEVKNLLEKHYKDMQDIEFTIEDKKLYLLQTRNGKRTIEAGIKIAVDMHTEGLISKEEAVLSIDPEEINRLLHPTLVITSDIVTIAKGLPASPGAACGAIALTSEVAQRFVDEGKVPLLVRTETSPEDIKGMAASSGILTAKGGMTSHAAVVARGMGKPCISGCSDLSINEESKTIQIKSHSYKEGDIITIDGKSGEIYDGEIETKTPKFTADFDTLIEWADSFRILKIRTNADNPHDSAIARNFGAEGIGLCRTEHMFFEPERLLAIREMIFANDLRERETALEKLIPFQRNDFEGIFTEMNGLPVNIRLLDPPLHEFLPRTEEEISELSNYLNISSDEIIKRKDELHEFNPMLGHRGCRLGVTYPEIYKMQVRAIIEAGIKVSKNGVEISPEIMIPLIALKSELDLIKNEIELLIKDIFKEQGTEIKYKIGTMIELPRAAITAGSIAESADFFSFGTNDLTQTTFGLSRDDAGKFLPYYINNEVIPVDPFVSLDQEGVGFLVALATKEGKKHNPNIHIGICGEHGGDPQSIKFCHDRGLDYVSCSPFRVPIARLAAAQAAITKD